MTSAELLRSQDVGVDVSGAVRHVGRVLTSVSVSQVSPRQPSSPVSRHRPRPCTPPHGGENGKTHTLTQSHSLRVPRSLLALAAVFCNATLRPPAAGSKPVFESHRSQKQNVSALLLTLLHKKEIGTLFHQTMMSFTSLTKHRELFFSPSKYQTHTRARACTLFSLHCRVSSTVPCCGFMSPSQWAAPQSGQT